MSDLRAALSDIYSLEELSGGTSAIHSIDARAKIAGSLFYIAVLLSFGRYELSALTPFLACTAAASAAAGIPPRLILKRSAAALPFCFFAAVSSLFFDRTPLFSLMGRDISGGWLIFFSILLRSFICVFSVLILIATTPMHEITRALRCLHVPESLVFLFEMTCRYAGTIAEEALSMRTAYALRGRSLKMGDMGSFAGQLLLRSLSRAERISWAVKCRGGLCGRIGGKSPLRRKDFIFLAAVCGSALFFRAVNIPLALGRLMTCLF